MTLKALPRTDETREMLMHAYDILLNAGRETAMTTLIAVYNSDGCVGRCDAKCYDAVFPECDCICGGRNHGSGKQQAVDNTRELAEQWIDKWKQAHPDTTKWTVPAAQLDLFATP